MAWIVGRRAEAAGTWTSLTTTSVYLFSTVDWVVDGRRERVKMQRQEESVQRITQRAHGQEPGEERSVGERSIGVQVRSVVDLVRRWLGPATYKLHAPLVSAAENCVVVLVGALIGINMAVISVVAEWASDLKHGHCATGWWLNKKFCCWEVMDPEGPGGNSVPAGIAAAAQGAAATLNATTPAASALQQATHLLRRAESSPPELAETCIEWVEWAHWTVPAWLIYVLMSVCGRRVRIDRQGLFAGICAFLVKFYAPFAAGSGISEIKCQLSGFAINGFLNAWTLAIKSLGLPLMIASGLSVGKEGPAVHVACCIGNVVGDVFHRLMRSQGTVPCVWLTAAKMRELITASSAAGIAVAFGSPIGGVLFALEVGGEQKEMTSQFPPSTMWRTFLCALASIVALSFMNPFRTGKLVLFQVEYSRDWHYFEILFYIVIGVCGVRRGRCSADGQGLYGEYVVRYNLQAARFRKKRLAKYGVEEAVVLAVLTAMVSYFNRFMRIDMTEALEVLFRQCEGTSDSNVLCQSRSQWAMVGLLLVATALRFVLVTLSYGCKVPAGIFVPSMAIGATFGRMVGILVKALQTAHPTWNMFASCPVGEPCITPGTYAVLGAAAALAGVTRITVAIVVIMFELTGALTYILPIMLVVGIAKLVADLHGKGGVSERLIRFNGFPYLAQDDHATGVSVGELLRGKPAVLYAEGMPLDAVQERLTSGTYKGFPVVRSAADATLVGYAARNDLRCALGKAQHGHAYPSDTTCIFTPRSADAFAWTSAQRPAEGTDAPWFSLRRAPRFRVGDDDDALQEGDLQVDGSESDGSGSNAVPRALDMGAWVDPVRRAAALADHQTPLIVQPELDLEVVTDMFKQLGPRVILVAAKGVLVGIVTIKDLLKYMESKERAESVHGVSEAVTHCDSDTAVGSGGLERALDSLWLALSSRWSRLGTPRWAQESGLHAEHVQLTAVSTVYEQDDVRGP
ncbi:glycerol ethanol, ferric requiring protein [Malassezia sp. CBS 17886]|nr:glycerol ethanol, ferric requiring protein [Malassezia sp. CBS 17886]